MSDKNYYTELFQGSIAELRMLFGTAYSSESPLVDLEFLRWQYEQNPVGEAIIACGRSKEDDSLVGVYIVAPVDLWLVGERKRGALSLNTFTREDFRGQGMFTALAQSCYTMASEAGINAVVGFPNPMSYGGFIKKLGFVDLGNVNYLVRPLGIVNLVKRYLPLTQKTFEGWWKPILRKDIELIDWVEAVEVDSFYKEHRTVSQLQKYRNSAYQKWRFWDHPNRKYNSFAIRSNSGEYGAVIVLGEPLMSKNRELRIVDFCVTDFIAGKELLRVLKKVARKQFSFLLAYAQPATLEFELLKQAGFINRNRFKSKAIDVPFIVKSLSNEEVVVDFNRWHICMSDTDVV